MPIVRRGSPIASNVGPLMGMSFPTVEGRLRLGYLRGGVGLYLPIDPTVPNPAPVVPVVHGVGAAIARRPRRRGVGAAVTVGDVITPNSANGPQGATATLENLTTGDASNFKVGDAWRVTIRNAAPNRGVYLNAQLRGMPLPMSGQQDLALSAWTGSYQDGNQPIGQTDGSGNWSSSGTFQPAQAGAWFQQWNPGELLMPLQFTVANASGGVPANQPNAVPGGTAYWTLAQNNVPTQPAPTDVVQTLADQLAGRVILPTGQIVAASSAASGAPPAGSSSAASSAPGSGSGTMADLTNLVSGFSMSSIPTWGWIAAAGVGALILFGGHKH